MTNMYVMRKMSCMAKGSHLSELLSAVDAERMPCQLMGLALHSVQLLLPHTHTHTHTNTCTHTHAHTHTHMHTHTHTHTHTHADRVPFGALSPQ